MSKEEITIEELERSIRLIDAYITEKNAYYDHYMLLKTKLQKQIEEIKDEEIRIL